MFNHHYGRSAFVASVVVMSTLMAPVVSAHAPSGAIFTTVADGSEVNFNIYPSKEAVYLDGGPGPGAPATAAGLDDGTYVFQITDPSGKTLLSTDPAKCRQFVVTGGIITGIVPVGGCEHVTGFDIDHGAATVQMFPYDDTPNPGGVYKAWVVRVGDFLSGCAALGENNGLEVVDCGRSAGDLHGFVPRHTKTDNFKVGETNNLEIDTRFYSEETGELLDGIGLTWNDTVGGSNTKYSYLNAQLGVEHFSHIEAVEPGVHEVTVSDQPGCRVMKFFCGQKSCGNTTINGPGTISVRIRHNDPTWTHYLYVYCQTTP